MKNSPACLLHRDSPRRILTGDRDRAVVLDSIGDVALPKEPLACASVQAQLRVHIDISEDTIKSRLQIDVFDIIGLWLSSLSDPDDPIGFSVVAYVATDDTIPLPVASNQKGVIIERLMTRIAMPAWAPDPSNIEIAGDGASYRLNRFASKR